jgi:hypothetical protein
MQRTPTATLFALCFLAAAAATAQAQDRYFLLSVGNSNYMGNGQADADAVLAGAGQTGISSSLATRGTGYKAMLGYRLTPTWSVEGGYVDLGSYSYSATSSGGGLTATYRGLGLNASALGFFPLNGEVSVFGKMGLTYSGMKGSGANGALTLDNNQEKAGLGYGVGGLYHLTDKLGLRAEWERLNSDISLFSVGLQVRF